MVGPRTTHLPFSHVGVGALHGHWLPPALPAFPPVLVLPAAAPPLPAVPTLAPPVPSPAAAAPPLAELPPLPCPAFAAPAFDEPAPPADAPLAFSSPPVLPSFVTGVSSMPTIFAQPLSVASESAKPLSVVGQRAAADFRNRLDISKHPGAPGLRRLVPPSVGPARRALAARLARATRLVHSMTWS